MSLSDGCGKVGQVSERMAHRQDAAGTRIEIGIHVDRAGKEVEFDLVIVLHDGDRAAHGRFGAAMNADSTARDSGDTCVGEKCDFAIQFGHGERGTGHMHFRHPECDRAAAADDNDVAGFDLACCGSIGDAFGVLEADGTATELRFVQ